MNIGIGLHEVCGLVNVYADSLKGLGHDVTTFVHDKNRFYPDEKYDWQLKYWFDIYRNKKRDYPFIDQIDFWNRNFLRLKNKTSLFNSFIKKKILDKHDVFIYLWGGEYFLPSSEDLRYLKKRGKKIVSILVGSDVRYPQAFSQEYSVNVDDWPTNYHNTYSWFNSIIRNIEKYSDIIYSVPDQMGLAIRSYNHFQIPLDLSRYNYFKTDNNTPLVVHAPSKASIKGSDIILSTLDSLKNEGLNFNLQFIENMPNRDLLKLLTNADIVVDELVLHGPGVLSFEAMASGCAVATKTLKSPGNFFKPPVVSIDRNNIYNRLKELITDKSLRNQLISEGREYVEKNNRAEIIVQKILDDLKNPGRTDHDPQFFKDDFMLPESELITSIDKKLNREVSEKWMKGFGQRKEFMKQRGLI